MEKEEVNLCSCANDIVLGNIINGKFIPMKNKCILSSSML